MFASCKWFKRAVGGVLHDPIVSMYVSPTTHAPTLSLCCVVHLISPLNVYLILNTHTTTSPYTPLPHKHPSAISILNIRPNFFYLVALGTYAGTYYWRSDDRIDNIKIKLVSSDTDVDNDITMKRNDEEIERMWRTLEWIKKGMVKITGLLEGGSA